MAVFGQDYARERRNSQEVEYCIKKVEVYRREEAELQWKAGQALADKQTQLRYARQNAFAAAQYFRAAANALN